MRDMVLAVSSLWMKSSTVLAKVEVERLQAMYPRPVVLQLWSVLE